MKQNIRKFVDECEVCQRNKGETVKSPGTLQPLPIPLLFGRISLWTLLQAYPNRGINQS
jgi:hypothetical protein